MVRAVRIFLLLLSALISTLPAVAVAQERTIVVKFRPGTSGTTIEDSIVGYAGIRYIVGVAAGQTMSVQLDTDNSSNYFNITAPGASEALFNGSVSGGSTSFVIPSSGDYVIDVYLMRNAARRGERANFDLSIYVEGRATQTPQPPTRPNPPRPDFADGMAGGPDFWQVTGLSGGDVLNIRASASARAQILGTLRNGDVVTNLGCTMNGNTRWCRIAAGRSLQGWVAGRYLKEASVNAQTLPSNIPATSVPSGPDAIAVSDMPRYCRGEAAAEYNVNPQAITVGEATPFPSRYLVVGSVIQNNGRQTLFTCAFGRDGSFMNVM